MMRIQIFILIALLLPAAQARLAGKVKISKGKIYELNSARKIPLFTMNGQLRTNAAGQNVFKCSYFDQDQIEVMSEEATYDRLSLQNYVIKQKQLNEIYHLDIVDNKMNFSIIKNGEVRKKVRDLPEDLIIGPSFVPFLSQHWSEIQNKKKVRAQLAVLEEMDTFNFDFEKLVDQSGTPSNAVTVRMEPVSLLIAAFVRPLYFVVKSDGSQIFEVRGHMLPKRKIGSRLEDFEGDAIFAD